MAPMATKTWSYISAVLLRIRARVSRLANRSDFWYTVRRYKRRYGRYPNLLRPCTHSEYINRSKLFRRYPLLTVLADKYAVRDYVRDRVGQCCLTQLYLVTDEPAEIDLESLPDSFVVKATHGSGWNIIVTDKSLVSQQEIRRQCSEWLRLNYYAVSREWCYRNIKPRILIEELLGDENGKIPCDYKVHCYNGVPKFIQVDFDRFEHHTRALFDTAWNRLPVSCTYDDHDEDVPAPATLDRIIDVAGKLAHGLDFVRVDLYGIRDRVYFGEMTLYPGAGFVIFEPDEYDLRLGSYWSALP
jgi:hypothetical protein